MKISLSLSFTQRIKYNINVWRLILPVSFMNMKYLLNEKNVEKNVKHNIYVTVIEMYSYSSPT